MTDPGAASAPGVAAPRPRRALLRVGALLGPGFVASIAYVDPGNVATNVQAGATYRYLLVWVLVAANTMALLIQYQSAKLGLLTGRSLPELLGERLGRPGRLAFWAQAELVAAATDLAEVLGGAIALQLLLGVPLLVGGVLVGAIAIVLVSLQTRGQRLFERVTVALLAVIALGFLAGLLPAAVDWPRAAGGLVPRFAGAGSVVLAASMLGATVMPHAIYLHSALARDRHGRVSAPDEVARLLRATRIDVGAALAVAGVVNVAMLLVAAASLPASTGTTTLESAHASIVVALGAGVGALFAVGLLASGLASTSVGSYAGAVVMAGLLRIRMPLLLRRVLTLVPALIVLGLGVDPTAALVVSQLLLSLGIPFALVPLVRLGGDAALLGERRTGPAARTVLWAVTALVVVLNLTLIALTLGGAV